MKELYEKLYELNYRLCSYHFSSIKKLEKEYKNILLLPTDKFPGHMKEEFDWIKTTLKKHFEKRSLFFFIRRKKINTQDCDKMLQLLNEFEFYLKNNK